MGAEAQVYQGAYGLDHLVSGQRRYDIDGAFQLTWRMRYQSPFPHLLIMNTAKKVSVGDLEIKRAEQEEQQTRIRIVAGGAADASLIYVHPDDVGLLQANTVLQNSHVMYTGSGTTPYTAFTDATLANALAGTSGTPDQAIVIGRSGTTSAVTGTSSGTYVGMTIQRLWQVDGLSATNNATGTDWASGHYITRLGKTNYENGNAGLGITKNLSTITSYLMKIEREYELTDWQIGVRQWYDKDPLARNKQLAVEDYGKTVESFMLFGNGRAITNMNGGRPMYMMYGLNSRISSTYRRAINGYNKRSINNALGPIMDVGSKGDRYAICGKGFTERFAGSFESHEIYNDPEMKKMVGMSLTTFKDHRGNLIHLAESTVMSDDPMFTNAAFVVNFDYLNYAYLEGEDMRIWKGPNGNGLQANDSPGKKYSIRSTMGLLWKSSVGQGLLYYPS